MDLIKDENGLTLHDDEWKIYSVNPVRPAQYIGKNAEVKNSLVVEGCVYMVLLKIQYYFKVYHVGKNTIIRDSVIMPDAKIGENVVIEKAIIGEKL